ncbi:hypothetical protein AAHN93_03090 [Vandammella animalimorsus]|uniref:hypothetical protein n=1 Tax=Vandammella animalimorsus TaxID=2029117 RepID=UPI0011781BF9|nr:hypothetical protein [Vandammella animalimorsus]
MRATTKASVKTSVKTFGSGLIGAGLVLALYLVLAPGYADYRARVESGEVLRNLHPVQAEIEARAKQQGSLSGVGLNIQAKLPANARLFIQPDGMLIAHGQQHGQMLVLIPSHTQGRTTWACLASGQAKDMPSACHALGPPAARPTLSSH